VRKGMVRKGIVRKKKEGSVEVGSTGKKEEVVVKKVHEILAH
jgi:hypothetical protein